MSPWTSQRSATRWVAVGNEDKPVFIRGVKPPESSQMSSQLFGPLRKGLSIKKRPQHLKRKDVEEEASSPGPEPFESPGLMIRIEGKVFMKSFKNVDLSKLGLKEIPLELNHFQEAKVLTPHPRSSTCSPTNSLPSPPTSAK